MAVIKPRDNPSTPSSDYLAMIDDWTLTADIRKGWRAIRSKGTTYLPQYQQEKDGDYKRRLESTPWRPEFVDALRNLCSKPFTKEVTLQGSASDRVKLIAEDIDGQGNSLHAFTRSTFTDGVADGVVGIYVTFPDADPAPTVAEEVASGVRPYWVPIKAVDIIALYTKKVNGRDIVQHIRMKECKVVQDKFAENEEERIRVIEMNTADTRVIEEVDPDNQPWFYVYKKTIDPNTKEITWPLETKGALSLKEIPIVLFWTGERSGHYRVKPPLSDLANMQLEIYRALSREDEILTYAGSPMLKMKGMAPPEPTIHSRLEHGKEVQFEKPARELDIGPKIVVWCPPAMEGSAPDADYIQPAAANITAVSANVNDKIDHFRELSMQPATPSSGRLSATQTAVSAAKAHSAIEVWANSMKDVIEQAFIFTTEWIKEAGTVEVSIHTDFGIDIEGVDEYANLITMNTGNKLSDETLWDEGQRRGILGPQFDKNEEKAKLAEQVQGQDALLNGGSGQPINPRGGPSPSSKFGWDSGQVDFSLSH